MAFLPSVAHFVVSQHITDWFSSCLQGSVNVHRGALLLVPQWQCISSFVFYCFVANMLVIVSTESSDLNSVWIFLTWENIFSLSALLAGRTRHAMASLDSTGNLNVALNGSFSCDISDQNWSTSPSWYEGSLRTGDGWKSLNSSRSASRSVVLMMLGNLSARFMTKRNLRKVHALWNREK